MDVFTEESVPLAIIDELTFHLKRTLACVAQASDI